MKFLVNLVENIVYISEGYLVWIWNILIGKTKQKAEDRLEICNMCPMNEHGICKECGCIIKAKVRVDFSEDENGISIDGCPQKKW